MVGGLNGLRARLKQVRGEGGPSMRNEVPGTGEDFLPPLRPVVHNGSVPAKEEEKPRREHEYRVVTRSPACRGVRGRPGECH